MRRNSLLLVVFLSSAMVSRAEDAAPPQPELEIPAPEAMVPASLPLQHAYPITAAAWSPDSARLAACDEEGNIVIWQSRGGGKVREWKDKDLASRSLLRAIAWSPDGALIATCGDEHASVWSATTGALNRTIRCPQVLSSVAFLPDSKSLIIAGWGGELVLASLSTDAAAVDLPAPAKGIRMISVSPDGKELAVAGWSPQVAVVDLPSGKAKVAVGADESTTATWVSWGLNQKKLYAGNPALGAREIDPVSGGRTDVSSSGLYDLISAGQCVPGEESMVCLTAMGKAFFRGLKWSNVPWTLDLARSTHDFVAVSPNGEEVAVPDGDDSLVVLRTVDGSFVSGGRKSDLPQRVSWSGDGSTVFATRGASEVHAFDSCTGKRLRGYIAPGSRFLGLAARDDGALVAATYGGAWLRVTDLTNSHSALRLPCKAPPAWSALSSDGSTFAWSTDDGGVRVLDAPQSSELPEYPPPTKPGDVFESLSPRGDVLMRGDPRTKDIAFFDTATGHEVQKGKMPVNDFRGASLSPDGALTAYWTTTRWTRFSVASTGRDYGRPIDNDAFGWRDTWIACAFSPDSRLFAILYLDALAVFDPMSQKGIVCFPLNGTGAAFAWSPDGSRLATLNVGGITRIWRLPESSRASQPRSDPNHDWGDMACLRLDRALSAAARLETSGPEAAALLREKFAEKENPAHIADLLKQLGDPDRARHDAAVEELTWLGVQAEWAIAAEIARVEPGAYREKLEGLLRQSESRFGPSAQNLQRIRGMEVLEGMATAESIDALRHISAESPSPRERADADTALRRIKLKSAR